MNAPVQGTLPWFYNQIPPMFEGPVPRCAESPRSPRETLMMTLRIDCSTRMHAQHLGEREAALSNEQGDGNLIEAAYFLHS